MIQVHELTKAYGDLRAVDGVSFDIRPGEAFGLLGPNGAGKSSTIHMIAGVLAPDSGTVSLGTAGATTSPEVRRALGVAPQGLAIYDQLTGAENLAFFGRLYGLSGTRLKERVDWGLEFAGLTDRRKDRAGAYSGGMKRRLNLACALVHEPQVLICDEPTVGVDPQSRNHIFERIKDLARGGMTLLYTTHYMEEAQALCDRVAIMDKGRILAMDTVDRLIAEHGGASVVVAQLAEEPAPGVTLDGERDGLTLRLETDAPLAAVGALAEARVRVDELRIDRPTLERVFLHLTGKSLRD